jgi:DNA primase catalytic subunit
MESELIRTKERFLKYYRSKRFDLELALPESPNFHHFRFELFSQERTFKRLRDVVRNKEILKTAIVKEVPKGVFFSPVKWLDPTNVRRRIDRNVGDYMLSSPLYFDIDKKLVPGQTLSSAITVTKKLIEYFEETCERKPDWTVFSGAEGFHVYYWEWDNIIEQYGLANKRIWEFIKSRKRILSNLYEKKIHVDPSVTTDPWRLLRVPGTIHADTCLVARLLEGINDFSLADSVI